jgi:hypothetical protein
MYKIPSIEDLQLAIENLEQGLFGMPFDAITKALQILKGGK